MQLNVYTVSFCGILIVRDEDGNETSRRVASPPQDITAAGATQNDAVDYAKRTLPTGLEINVQHVVQVANAVEIVGAAAANEDLVVANEQLTAKLAELEQSSGLATFQLNEQIKTLGVQINAGAEKIKTLQGELELTQKAFAASQQKPEEAPAQPAAEKLNDPANPNSEVVIDDQPPHRSITVGELKQREGDSQPDNQQATGRPEPPLDQQLATVEIPSEFDKPIDETPAQGSAPAAS